MMFKEELEAGLSAIYSKEKLNSQQNNYSLLQVPFIKYFGKVQVYF